MKEQRIKKMMRECRFSLNLTISDLAFMLDVSDRTVCRWISGECLPHYDHRLRIYEVYALLQAPKTTEEQFDIRDRLADDYESTLKRCKKDRIKTNMGLLLRALKDHLMMNQLQLAKYLGFTQGCIYRWINGHSLPRSSSCEVIFCALQRMKSPITYSEFWTLYEHDIKDRSERSKTLRRSNAAK